MTAHEVLQEASRRGIVLTPAGTSIRFRGPKDALSEDLKQALKRHKPEILQLLGAGRSTYPCSLCGPSHSPRLMSSATGADAPPRRPMKRSGLPPNDPLRALGDGLGQTFDSIITSWPSHRSSDHFRLEVAAAFDADRKCSSPSVDTILAQGVADIEPRTRRWYLDHFSEPSVLDVDRPVPGCGCPGCTGIPSDHPVRQRQLRKRQAGHERFDERVERARAVPLLEIVQRLGLGTPAQKGRELTVCCPLNDDSHPSLQLNPAKRVWYYHPCGIGGDAIKLYMRARRIEFAEAVRELVS